MQEERLLENAGVEGAALANKLVILTAVAEAARLSGRDETAAALADVRDEASAMWDELREQVPELMRGLVGRAGPPRPSRGRPPRPARAR
jgi:hypothetical protein